MRIRRDEPKTYGVEQAGSVIPTEPELLEVCLGRGASGRGEVCAANGASS